MRFWKEAKEALEWGWWFLAVLLMFIVIATAKHCYTHAYAEAQKTGVLNEVFCGTHYVHRMSTDGGKTWKDVGGKAMMFVSKNAIVWLQSNRSSNILEVYMDYEDGLGLQNYFSIENSGNEIAFYEFRSWPNDPTYAMFIVYYWDKNKKVYEAARSLHTINK